MKQAIKAENNKINFAFKKETLSLYGTFLKGDIPIIYDILFKDNNLNLLKKIKYIDGSEIIDLDSAGVAFLDEISEHISSESQDCFIGFSPSLTEKIDIFSSKNIEQETPIPKISFLEALGGAIYEYLTKLFDMIVLTSDIVYWSIIAIWNQRGQRKGSLSQQSVLIGADALPIVTLLSFIIGLIISLQSAVQLKQFGADQFLANLLAFTLVRELSPLITAIILAGRSGSAIASEIATMKVTEEIDALKMMALNPIRYIVVPKFHAVTICMSLLILFSIIVGIFGGLIIAVTVLNLSPIAFLKTCIEVITIKDLMITLIKSTVFAWQIVIIGSHYGFQVTGGAEGVGKATTQAVVSSIFGVIIMDAIFSLIYLI